MKTTAVSLLALVTGIAFAACDGSDSDPGATSSDGGDPPAIGPTDASTNDAASSSDAAKETDAADADATPCTPPSTPPRVLFLNKGGGIYTAGPDDSRANISSIVDVTTMVNPWTVSPAAWTVIVECVKQKLAPFNVTVTDTDPGTTTQHVEVVFAQNVSTIFGGANSVGPLTCSVKENAIAYVSQTHAEAGSTNGCAAAAQLYGYAMGLEPVSTCPDAMTFDYTACTTAAFSKVPVNCGATAAANCTCGAGTTQTSFDKLLAVLGPRCL